MPWIIGIDEAGYGPNLGPLVVTCVALDVPENQANPNLWEVLKEVVCKQPTKDDGRLPVNDSKELFTPTRGLALLERSVLAFLGSLPHTTQDCVAGLVGQLASPGDRSIFEECWFDGATPLPLESASEDITCATAQLREGLSAVGIKPTLISSDVICTSKFNDILTHWQSKAAALGLALARFVDQVLKVAPADAKLVFHVDKHGGRNNYAAMLQSALPGGFVLAQQESAVKSCYAVLGLDRSIRFEFQPRADAEHFPVALASMVSKYVREILMADFNRFWQKHVQDLKPTAGYPLDAGRFFAEIQPAIKRLGLKEEQIWRRR